jgi:hypothetical protein
MISIFSQLYPELKIKNKLPTPLSLQTKANLKYKDVLNYFSQLNSG